MTKPKKPVFGPPFRMPLKPLKRDATLRDRRQAAAVYDEKVKRFAKSRYGISSDDGHFWKKLAQALLHELVPGFREKTPRGAPSKWTPGRYLYLLDEVAMRQYEAATYGISLTEPEVCKQLSKEEPFKRWGKGGKPIDQKTLHRELQRAKALRIRVDDPELERLSRVADRLDLAGEAAFPDQRERRDDPAAEPTADGRAAPEAASPKPSHRQGS